MEKNGIIYEKIKVDGINDYWVVQKSKSLRKTITLESEIQGLPVKGIMPYSFLKKYTLESIVIPDNYEYIGEHAFHGCEKLQNVYISVTNNTQNILKLYEGCFENCFSLVNIVGDKTLELVEPGVFLNCCNLKLFGYCNQITGNIPRSAFRGCRSLEFVHNIGEKCRIFSDSFLGCSSLSKMQFDCLKVTIPKYIISTLINKKIISSGNC